MNIARITSVKQVRTANRRMSVTTAFAEYLDLRGRTAGARITVSVFGEQVGDGFYDYGSAENRIPILGLRRANALQPGRTRPITIVAGRIRPAAASPAEISDR